MRESFSEVIALTQWPNFYTAVTWIPFYSVAAEGATLAIYDFKDPELVERFRTKYPNIAHHKDYIFHYLIDQVHGTTRFQKPRPDTPQSAKQKLQTLSMSLMSPRGKLSGSPGTSLNGSKF